MFDPKNMIKRAIILGCMVHKDDKWGDYPYSVHLSLVAQETRRLSSNNAELEAAAWLHDVIEDHPTFASTVKSAFPEIYESIVTVSRSKDETYDEFIERVINSGDELAVTLKLADMTVNLENNPAGSLRERYERNIGKLQRQVLNFSQE